MTSVQAPRPLATSKTVSVSTLMEEWSVLARQDTLWANMESPAMTSMSAKRALSPAVLWRSVRTLKALMSVLAKKDTKWTRTENAQVGTL